MRNCIIVSSESETFAYLCVCKIPLCIRIWLCFVTCAIFFSFLLFPVFPISIIRQLELKDIHAIDVLLYHVTLWNHDPVLPHL